MATASRIRASMASVLSRRPSIPSWLKFVALLFAWYAVSLWGFLQL